MCQKQIKNMWHHLKNTHKLQLPISVEIYENYEEDREKELNLEFMKDLLTKFVQHEVCEKDRANQKKNQVKTFIRFVNDENLISRAERHWQKLKFKTIHKGLIYATEKENYLGENSILSPSTRSSHYGSLYNFVEFLRTERNFEEENPLEKELIIKDILKLLTSIRTKNKKAIQKSQQKFQNNVSSNLIDYKYIQELIKSNILKDTLKVNTNNEEEITNAQKNLLTLIVVRNLRRSKELKTFSIKEFLNGQMKEGTVMFRASDHKTAIAGAAELYLSKKENIALSNFVFNIREKICSKNCKENCPIFVKKSENNCCESLSYNNIDRVSQLFLL